MALFIRIDILEVTGRNDSVICISSLVLIHKDDSVIHTFLSIKKRQYL